MSRLVIAILEDDERRAEKMEARLRDRFPYDVRIFRGHTCEMIDWLTGHLDQTILISLDHDLNLLADEHGKSVDPGCGRDVSDFLLDRTVTFPIVIHSTNIRAATAMQETLEERGWVVTRITPYGDLEWVDEAWFPAVRASILNSATSKMPT
jgi:hypothetical protein